MTKPDLAGLEATIEKAFDERDQISTATRGEVREAIEAALDLLDRGHARVAERQADGSWSVNQWLKKAVLLSFRLNPMEIIKGGPGDAVWWDKVAVEILRLGRRRFREGRLPRRAVGDRPPLGLCRAGRGADAVLRQCRRLCR